MFIAPVPYFKTLSTTVPSSGLRIRIHSSYAGFIVVFQPSHRAASAAPSFSSIALPTLVPFGNPLLPVMKI